VSHLTKENIPDYIISVQFGHHYSTILIALPVVSQISDTWFSLEEQTK